MRVTIVGAGLGGGLLACLLGRRGYRVDVYERRPDPREHGFRGGRSINLALSTRGIDALQRVGLAERVLAGAVPMRGRMMHAANGELSFQPYSKNPGDAINSVSRGGLSMELLAAADAFDGVSLHFDRRCVDVDLERRTVALACADGNETVTGESDLVVGADGAFSAVRGRLLGTDRFDYHQAYLEHGFKELSIPPAADGSFAMEANALHIWPRGGFMMIALPNADRSFTCTCFWPFAGPRGFDAVRTDDDVRRLFAAEFADAVPLMPTLERDYATNPVGSLMTVRCRPWHYQDAVVLIGDAAHAVVPFYGQGMNASFEDCVVLDECLERHPGHLAAALAEYTALRKVNGDAIADLALRNFIEMRDKVGSRLFLLHKKVEKLLHRWLPRWFTPLYNMVTFSTIPYAEARRRARVQWRVLGVAGLAAALLVGAGVVAAARLLAG